jgi:2'-5' RNA ligase
VPEDLSLVGKGYALWLTPEEPAHDLLASQIARLSQEHSTPRFEPHITLVAGITLPEEEIQAKSVALAKTIRPFQIEMGKIGYTDEYFRCIFVHVVPTNRIINTHQAALQAFSLRDDKPYMPHISLAYGKLDPETKKRISAAIEPMQGQTFKVCGFTLWRVAGTPTEWKKIKKFDLW